MDTDDPITALKGLKDAYAKLFAKISIYTVNDLLEYYPRDYEDKTVPVPIADYATSKVNTVVVITGYYSINTRRGRVYVATIADKSGSAQLWLFSKVFNPGMLPVGSIMYVSGSFSCNAKTKIISSSSFDVKPLNMTGDISDLDGISIQGMGGILPLYNLTEGLNIRTMRRFTKLAIDEYSPCIQDTMPKGLIQKYSLMEKKDAIREIHYPRNNTTLVAARKSLVYREIFDFECTMVKRNIEHKGSFFNLNSINSGDEPVDISLEKFKELLSPKQVALLDSLPFSLTRDQMWAIDEMNKDIDLGSKECRYIQDNPDLNGKSYYHMSRLLEADVGAGKTLVAFFLCLRVIDYGGQCALMAPTELLAQQHITKAMSLLAPLGVKVAFLSGNIKGRERKDLVASIACGEVDIIVGTHAVFSNDVSYKSLKLVVIDEQHRFGVIQRESLLSKGKTNNDTPHLLMMSATPIPQTLALTVYGDLDIIKIKTMPQGRLPVKTLLIQLGHEETVYSIVKGELSRGRQAYFVYPRIEDDSDSELKSCEASYKELSTIFTGYKVTLLHSKIPEEKKKVILDDFTQGKIQVLLSTSVVEVGVDVPLATCMVILQSERFGLAQLHQLRGRVGRSKLQSYCFLVYNSKIGDIAKERLKVMHSTTDGFDIAEKDLNLRGPGELLGIAQSGEMKLHIADFVKDSKVVEILRHDVTLYINSDKKDIFLEQPSKIKSATSS